MKICNSRNKENLLRFIEQLRGVFRLLFPQTRKETYLLMAFFVFYFSYGIYISLKTSIIYNPRIYTDIYFSFDNSAIYQSGYENLVGHPLMVFFTYPFIFIGDCITYIFGDTKFKTIFSCLICSLLISSSLVYIKRYLREIIHLRGYILYVILLLFAFLSTNLILSFTPESFTITSFLLCFFIYYCSKCISNKEDIPFSVNFVFAILLGGVTVTNTAKAIIPMLYLKRKPKVLLKQISIISLFFFTVYCILQFLFNISDNFYRRVSHFKLKSDSIYEYIIDLFYGSPILFPQVKSQFVDFWEGLMNVEVITLDFYHFWWQYLFIGIIFILLVLSVIINYKNKCVQIISLCVGVDLFIHIIMKYGLQEPFIYGAHWVYCLPLLLGWLYKSLNKVQAKLMSVLIACLFVVLVVNNLYQLKEFIVLASRIFPLNS